MKDEFLFLLPDDLAQARLLVQQVVHRYNKRHTLVLTTQLQTDYISSIKAPSKNPNGAFTLLLSMFSRTRQVQIFTFTCAN